LFNSVVMIIETSVLTKFPSINSMSKHFQDGIQKFINHKMIPSPFFLVSLSCQLWHIFTKFSPHYSKHFFFSLRPYLWSFFLLFKVEGREAILKGFRDRVDQLGTWHQWLSLCMQKVLRVNKANFLQTHFRMFVHFLVNL
jgi:hypothetical protein